MTHDGLAAEAEIDYVVAVDPGNATDFEIAAGLAFPTNAVGMWLEVIRGSKITRDDEGEAGMWRKVITRTSAVKIVTEDFPAEVEIGDLFRLHRLQRKVHNAIVWVDGSSPAVHIAFHGGARTDADGAPRSPKITEDVILHKSSRDGFDSIYLKASDNQSSNFINILGW